MIECYEVFEFAGVLVLKLVFLENVIWISLVIEALFPFD
jgi:hypothetical protein